MEKYRPTPRQWFADPKLPAGASGTEDSNSSEDFVPALKNSGLAPRVA